MCVLCVLSVPDSIRLKHYTLLELPYLAVISSYITHFVMEFGTGETSNSTVLSEYMMLSCLLVLNVCDVLFIAHLTFSLRI